METLTLERTPKTPEVNFDSVTGIIKLKGVSIPENSIEFYKPLYAWIENYGNDPKPKTTVNIVLEYFNTTSSKCVLDLLTRVEALSKRGNTEVTLNWYYENDDADMYEAAEDYQSIIDIELNMIGVPEI